MPFKMMGKSPLMKKLVGNQSKLPEHLKAKIEAAPESPAKLKKASPAKNNGAFSQDFKNAYNYFFGDGKKTVNKDGVSSIQADAAKGVTSGKTDAVLAEKEKLKNKKQKEQQDLFSKLQEEEENFYKDNNTTQDNNTTKEKTGLSNSSVSLQKSSIDPYNFSTSNRFNKNNGVAQGQALGEKLNVTTKTPTLSENIKNTVTEKVQVGSGSTKRLPIDAMQDRLTKNIDRRSRKADVRKQTRTAKKSLRQEGFKRSAARDKVGKLGINPNTGKSFENAKQKQDFINAKGKDTFISDLQKKIGKTMKKGGVDPNTSNKKETKSDSKVPKLNAFGKEGILGGQSFGIGTPKKKTTGDNFLNNFVNTPKLKGAGKKATEGVSFGTKTSKQKTTKPEPPKTTSKKSKLLNTKSFNVDEVLSKKSSSISDDLAKTQAEPTKKQLVSKSLKSNISEGKKRRDLRKAKRVSDKNERKESRNIKRTETNVKPTWREKIQNKRDQKEISKIKGSNEVPYKIEEERKRKIERELSSKRITNPAKMKKSPVKKTVGKFKVEKPPTPPTKMKTKTPSKMMKKAPSKMMKKAAAPKMMKKAPAKMMKKKKK